MIEKQCDRELELAKARAGELHEQYRRKQRDYQDLRAETLKVVQGIGRLNVDLLNSLIDETTAQLKELEAQMNETDMELRELASSAERVRKEYAQLMDWAARYDNCAFDAKKMIAAQFIKAIHIKRNYEVDVEFNLSFDEFQRLYLEPEGDAEKGTRADAILSFVEAPVQVR